MRKLKIISTALLGVVISVCTVGVPVFAGTSTVDTVKNNGEFLYTKSWDGIRIKGYVSNDKEPIIPSDIEGSPVLGIDDGAFSGNTNITSLGFTDDLKYIGNEAFKNCTSLVTVFSGDGVKKIGNSAFSGCTSLNRVDTIDYLESIGSSAFSGCKSLDSIKLPSKLKDIGDKSFYGCSKLSSVDIPMSVQTIGLEAFSSSGLARISIPNIYTRLAKNTLDSGVAVISKDFEYEITNSASTIVKVTSTEESITIPPSVNSIFIAFIGDKSFNNLNNVKNITIECSVSITGDNTFYNCPYLNNINVTTAVAEQMFLKNVIDKGNVDVRYGVKGVDSIRHMIDSKSYVDAKVMTNGTSLLIDSIVGFGNDVMLPTSIGGLSVEGFTKEYSSTGARRIELPDNFNNLDNVLFSNSKTSGYATPITFKGVSIKPCTGGLSIKRDVYSNLDSYDIPAVICGLKVVTLEEGAFADEDIDKPIIVNLPYSLTYLGHKCFDNPNVIGISFKPLRLEYFENDSFYGMTGLKCFCVDYYMKSRAEEFSTYGAVITESDFLYSKLSNGKLSIMDYVGSSKDLVIHAELDHTKVYTIGKGAFSGSGLSSVSLFSGIVVDTNSFIGFKGTLILNNPDIDVSSVELEKGSKITDIDGKVLKDFPETSDTVNVFIYLALVAVSFVVIKMSRGISKQC